MQIRYLTAAAHMFSIRLLNNNHQVDAARDFYGESSIASAARLATSQVAELLKAKGLVSSEIAALTTAEYIVYGSAGVALLRESFPFPLLLRI